MSDEEIKRWKEIIGGFEYITDIHVPRFAGNSPAQLLCFCDASNKVNAIAIHLRKITNDTINLLFSKTQNAPKKKTYQEWNFHQYKLVQEVFCLSQWQ